MALIAYYKTRQSRTWRDEFLHTTSAKQFKFSSIVAAFDDSVESPIYVQTELDEKLTEFGSRHGNVLLVGRPGSGKTHAVLTCIRENFADWGLLVPRRSALTKGGEVRIPRDHFVLLLDDVDRFIDLDQADGSQTLFEFVETLRAQAKELVVFATIRSTQPHASEISEIFRTFKAWSRIPVTDWSEDQANHLALLLDRSTEYWDGTPLSIKQPPREIIQRINSAPNSIRRIASILKLLNDRHIFPLQRDILRDLTTTLFTDLSFDFTNDLRTLEDIGFLKENTVRVTAYDAYLEAYELAQDIPDLDTTLLDLLPKREGWRELKQLAEWFLSRDPATAKHDEQYLDIAHTAASLAVNGKPDHPKNHYTLARIYGLKRNNEAALKHYQISAKLLPSWATLWMRIASTLRKLDRETEAMEAQKNYFVLSAGNDPIARDLIVANAFAEDGQQQKALTLYQSVADRGSLEGMRKLSRLLIEMQRFPEAVLTFKKLVELQPDAYQVRFGLAEALQGARDYRAAIDAVQKALGMKPTLELAWITLCYLHNRFGEANAILDHAEAGLNRCPNSAKLFSYKGQALCTLHRYREAEKALLRAVELDPEHAEPWVGLGQVYRSTGNYKRAEEVNLKALSINPRSYSAHFGLGLLYMRHQPKRAEKHLRDCLADKPDFGLARFALARALCKQRFVDEALSELEQAKALGVRIDSRLRNNPDFQLLRELSRFQALLS